MTSFFKVDLIQGVDRYFTNGIRASSFHTGMPGPETIGIDAVIQVSQLRNPMPHTASIRITNDPDDWLLSNEDDLTTVVGCHIKAIERADCQEFPSLRRVTVESKGTDQAFRVTGYLAPEHTPSFDEPLLAVITICPVAAGD